MIRPRILVTGTSGQVGAAAGRAMAHLGEIITPGRDRLDLADAASIRSVMRELRPSWVVNAAAHTAVDKAESEPELAYAINAEAPGILGQEAKASGAAVIHFSTDYVFDGEKDSPYLETDATGPLNVYGKSKEAGEQALAASGAAHLIFRTSWVYGGAGKNFLLSILRMARDREELRIVADQHGAPTWSEDLAQLTAHAVERISTNASQRSIPIVDAASEVSGLYHAGGAGETTWCGFAQAAVERLAKYEPGTRLAKVTPITTAEYPTPARRPKNSRLNCGKLKRNLGWEMMPWQRSLEQVMQSMLGSG